MARVKRTRADAFGGDLAAAVAAAAALPAAPPAAEAPSPAADVPSAAAQAGPANRRRSPRSGRGGRATSVAPSARRPAHADAPRALPPPPQRPLPPRQRRTLSPPPPSPVSRGREPPAWRGPGQDGSRRASVGVGVAYPATSGATSIPTGRHPPLAAPRVGRTNGRMGFVLDEDAHAARRTVPVPEGSPSVNRMQVFDVPALGIPGAEKKHINRLTKRAAEFFLNDRLFCQQARHVIAGAIIYLEQHEPRLAVCVRSWGSCALLSKRANYAYEHYRRTEARRLAAGDPPALHLPPCPPPRAPAPALPVVGQGGSTAPEAAQLNFVASFS